MKIVTILGARPQFIKAGSVSREIARQRNAGADICEVIVHTGQHYDANMSDVFFDEMKIPKPDYFLGVGGKSHGAMTGQMIEKVEEVVLKEQPDWMLVYGDTNSTLAGAVVASKLHIKLAHVEAGLRSFNMQMPEEVNRILTDRVSDVLFCPTVTAVDNLSKEGFPFVTAAQQKQAILNVGDVMLDGAQFYRGYAQKPVDLDVANFVLCTVHRAENTDDPQRLQNIFDALNEVAEQQPIVLPLHPRTKNLLPSTFSLHPNINIIDPVGYLSMVWLIGNCDMVMSDSGGLQKEAYFFSKPCITLRDETEWVELVEGGFNVLVGAEKERIVDTYRSRPFSRFEDGAAALYGDGAASKKIVDFLRG